MNTESTTSSDVSGPSTAPAGLPWFKLALLLVMVSLAVLIYFRFGDSLSLKKLAEHESQLRQFQHQSPLMVYGLGFLVYVTVTGLSIPGALVLTLFYGWYFGWVAGVIIVSFASAAGATIAFLLSRFLFRDAIQNRFGERLKRFNASLEREGPFFLFTLRLIPAVPFFIVNVVMGLTPIRTWTFYWVSQLGMLVGTAVYVYAGASVPSLQRLADEGVGAAFSRSQLTQIFVALALLGLLPWVTRWAVKWFSKRRTSSQI